eukprot:9495199-Alexandrium_andersonii.AAC.1
MCIRDRPREVGPRSVAAAASLAALSASSPSIAFGAPVVAFASALGRHLGRPVAALPLRARVEPLGPRPLLLGAGWAIAAGGSSSPPPFHRPSPW